MVITEVIHGGQGERIGLKAGDVVMSYDKKEVMNSARFIDARRGEGPGEKSRELIVLRDSRSLTFAVAPGLLQTRVEDRVIPETKLEPRLGEKGD